MSQLKRLRGGYKDGEDDQTPLSSSSEIESSDDEIGSSLGTAVSSINVGRNLLLKMGWTEGTGLGLDGSGRVDPVPISEKRGGDLTGIGKTNLDIRSIAISTAGRKALESERQMIESEADRNKRLAAIEAKHLQKEDVTQALKTYRCELCQKQYDRPSTFESHLNSYDHHHKKRFAELKVLQKGKFETVGLIDKKKDKERRREEKELAKMAQAAGINLSGAISATPEPFDVSYSTFTSSISKSLPASKTGGGGWKKLAAVSNPMTGHQNPTQIQSLLSNSSTSSGWKSVSSIPNSTLPEQSSTSLQKKDEDQIPKFRSSGMGILETSSESMKRSNTQQNGNHSAKWMITNALEN